ncbi:MAG: hypothetical protein ACU0FT_04230 [Paracoccus sp. (in: a-proteobacteria)]|uniref:hypothetical protein n=1 Tax=Paracoccus sp. TaxID=267 RepID=UPI004058C9DA
MTWFLNPAQAMPRDPEPVAGQIPSWGEQFTGAGQDLWLRRDSWGAAGSYRQDLAQEMEDALGGGIRRNLESADDLRTYDNPNTRGYIAARLIGQRAAADGRFLGLPTTAEEFDAEVQRRRQADFDSNRSMLDRGDSTFAKVLGEMAATIAEPASLATLPLGGSIANAGRFILMEGALGMASDVPGVIREQQVAKDLGFTPSDPLTELAMSGATAAGFAGIIVGAGRSIDYLRGRRRAETEARPAETSGMDWEEGVETADADLRAGREPAERVATQPSGRDEPIDAGYFAAIKSAESGGRADARNPNSTATGLYQFTQGTWEGIRRDHPDLNLTRDGRLDPAQQEMAIRAFTQDNADQLRQAGLAVNRGNLYAAHFLGAGDARRVLRASPDAMLTDLLAPQVIASNPFLRSMRVSDFRAWAARKTAGPGTGGVADDFQPVQTGSRADWTGPETDPLPQFGQVTTPGGMSVDVGYRVVDLSDLRAASGDLQPRDRSRSASDEQIAGIARNLDPRRLMPSPEAQSGTPVVGPDRVVESGNGRVAALSRAATENPDRYQAYIRSLEDAGYQIPEGVRRPVLVAERKTELDAAGRRRFIRESNTSSTGRMSATEQAGLDADYLTRHAFDGYRSGRGLNAPENAEFVRRVFAGMPQAERAALMTADGRLNIDGLRRLRQSLFARAFDAADLLKILAETEHPAVENLLRMLEDLAPDWAAFRALVENGQVRADFDMTDQLMDTVRAIARARTQNRDGQSVIAALRDRLAQGDMFGTRDRDMGEALIDVFYRGDRARPAEATASILQRYIADAEAFGRADMADLLGDEGALTPVAALRSAIEAQDARSPMPDRFAVDAADAPAAASVDLRALDGMETPEGAQSPPLMRAADAARRELADQPEVSEFGPVFREIENDPEAAIARLMQEQTGEVPVAFRHPDPRLGDIALVYGNEKFGLRHIEGKHPEMIAEIPRLLREGRIIGDTDGLKRIFLADGASPPNTMVLRLDWDGADKTWVVTSFRDERGQVARHLRTSDEPDASAPSRVPDATGPSEDIADFADFQGSEIQRAIADARAALDADPDLTIRLGEGDSAQQYALADVLDGLDRDESLIARMTSCSLKGSPK